MHTQLPKVDCLEALVVGSKLEPCDPAIGFESSDPCGLVLTPLGWYLQAHRREKPFILAFGGNP